MKQYPKGFYLLGLAALMWLFSAYVTPPGEQAGSLGAALEANQRDLHQGMDAFSEAIDHYLQLATDPQSPVDSLRSAHGASRMAYKRVEHLLAFAQPATITRHINGAPLPKTEPNVPEIVVLQPSGLQTLDELVWADEIDRREIKVLVQKLRGSYDYLHQQMQGLRLQHRHVFESLREQTIRIFTLGVTGFDTPSSGAALPEALANFATLQQSYGYYSPHVRALDSNLDQTINTAIARGQALLAAGDFDSFDRLTFLRQVINPLTEGLPSAQHLLNIESSDDVKTLPRPLAAGPTKLFNEDFLNPYYYGNFDVAADGEARRQLGQLLFFDPVLSKDLQLSCASCHLPEQAFTDGKAKSIDGTGKTSSLRNSPTLVNSVFAEKYFYDLREEFLERQMKHVVRDAHEFNTDFVEIENRLRQSDEYVALFEQAYADFPNYSLSKWSISDAVSRYVASLNGLNSPFDQYARGDADATIGEPVRRGFNLFMGKAACGTCHFAPTFSGLVPPYYTESESEVLGVPEAVVWEGATVDPDRGRIANSRPTDEVYFNLFAFKTPTVRNTSVTAPYMHNGVYTDLEQVMDFYNRGGGAGIGIQIDHQTLPPDPLGLTEAEITDIIEFMNSLEDYRELLDAPASLPAFPGQPAWNDRQIGVQSR